MLVASAQSVISGVPVIIGVTLDVGNPVVVVFVFSLPGGDFAFPVFLPVLTHAN